MRIFPRIPRKTSVMVVSVYFLSIDLLLVNNQLYIKITFICVQVLTKLTQNNIVSFLFMKYQNFLEVIIFYEVGFMFLNGGFGDTLSNAVCDETKKEGDEEGDDCLVVINQSGMDND